MHAVRWMLLPSVAVVVTVADVADAQALDGPRVRALEAQVANVYSMSATEAEFTEVRPVPTPNVTTTWRGRATFTKTGFVLEYTMPPGRRVVSDMTTTRTLDPSAPQLNTTIAARYSFYSKALAIMTGAERPSFESAQQTGNHVSRDAQSSVARYRHGHIAHHARRNVGYIRR